MKILKKLYIQFLGEKTSNKSTQVVQKISNGQNQISGSTPLRHPSEIPVLMVRRPSFLLVLSQALKGATALTIGYILDTFYYQNNLESSRASVLNELVKSAGIAMLFDSCLEFIQVMNYNFPKREINKNQRYVENLRKQNIAKNCLNIITTGLGFFQTCISFQIQLNQNISPLDYDFPPGFSKNAGAIFNYINVPITNTAILILMIQAFIYNSRELYLAIRNNKLMKEDQPFFKLLNGLSYIGASSSLFSMLPAPYHQTVALLTPRLPNKNNYSDLVNFYKLSEKIGEINEKYSPSPLIIPILLLNNTGRFEVYKGFAQMLLNIQEAFLEQVTIEIEELQPSTKLSLTSARTPRTTEFDSKKALNSKNANESHNISNQNSNSKQYQPKYPLPLLLSQGTSRPLALMPPTASSSIDPPLKTKGSKTKGINDPTQARKQNKVPTPFLNSSQSTPETKETKENLETEALRKEKLELITELRCYNQVNKRIIEKEFDCLTTFLPTAKINEGDGSEKSLCWKWKDKSFKLKYEVMHGKDDNEYRGRKLRKALNVLEAAYLWGWDKTKIEGHLNQRKKGSGLEKLMFVFTERAKL